MTTAEPGTSSGDGAVDVDAGPAADDPPAPPAPTWLQRVPGALDRGWSCAARLVRRAQGALNGILGHELHELGSALAVDLVVEPFAGQQPRAHLVVLVHGLMSTEDVWGFRGDPATNYGTLLADALDGTALYVRYNTGRRIGENGAALAAALEELTATWPVEVSGITLVGHSMGGLVTRSAGHHGVEAGARWPDLVRQVFLLGAPHGGAPLETVAHYTALGLAAVPLGAVRFAAEVLDQRSPGIKDLRHGRLLAPEPGTDGTDSPYAHRPIPLLPGAEHFIVAGHVGPTPTHLASRILGDWLVPVRSARRLSVPDDHVLVVAGTGHMALMHDRAIAEQLVAWATGQPLSPTAGAPAVEALVDDVLPVDADDDGADDGGFAPGAGGGDDDATGTA